MFKKSLFKGYFDNELDNNESQTRFIQERIKIVEKYIPQLGKALFNYADKNAKTRDSTDKIALALNEYAKAENLRSEFKLQISDFANILIDLGTKRDAQIRVMETRVLDQLSDYEKLCSHIQNQLKVSIMAGDKERSWVRQLKRVRASQHQDPEQVSLAEAEFIKARGESARSSKNLEEQLDIFEKKRLNSIKGALLAWTLAELHFHAKALQLFTDAYRVAADINVSADVEELRGKLKSADDTPRSDIFQKSDSMLQLISLPFRRKAKFTGNGMSHPSSIQSSPQSSRLEGCLDLFYKYFKYYKYGTRSSIFPSPLHPPPLLSVPLESPSFHLSILLWGEFADVSHMVLSRTPNLGWSRPPQTLQSLPVQNAVYSSRVD